MKKIKVIKKQHISALGQEPFEQVHASSVALCGDGKLAAVWFGGTEEKNPDVRIWFSKTDDDGRWSRPVALSENNGIADWNPALLARGNRLTLYYKEGKTTPEWRTFFRVSEDNGETWSEPKLLVEGDTFGRGPVKTAIYLREPLLRIRTEDGRYLPIFLPTTVLRGRCRRLFLLFAPIPKRSINQRKSLTIKRKVLFSRPFGSILPATEE